MLAPLVAAAPGRRVPGTAHPEEFALRAVLGQQVSTAAARTHAARLVTACGEPVDDPDGGLTHLFPLPAAVADVDPSALALPGARRRTVLRLAEALADGEVDLSPGADRAAALAALAGLPGIGPWTLGTVAMRALGDRDAFLPGDLGVRARGGPPRPAREPRGADPPGGGLAPLSRLRGAAPVGDRRPRGQPDAGLTQPAQRRLERGQRGRPEEHEADQLDRRPGICGRPARRPRRPSPPPRRATRRPRR